MGIKEIVDRITFLNNTNQDRKRAELKSFMNLMHFTISAGSSPTKKNNKIFHREIDKIFKDHQEPEETFEEAMNLVDNVKK